MTPLLHVIKSVSPVNTVAVSQVCVLGVQCLCMTVGALLSLGGQRCREGAQQMERKPLRYDRGRCSGPDPLSASSQPSCQSHRTLQR